MRIRTRLIGGDGERGESDDESDSVPDRRITYLLLLVGVGLLWLGYSDYATQEDRLENAIEVEAEILETEVDRRSSGSSSSSSYYPQVEFAYTYEGTTYTSSNIHATDAESGHSSRSSAESVLEAYPEGETVTAYVDPDEPGEAFLERERSNAPYGFAAVGALALLVGLYLFVKRRRAKRGLEGR